MIEQLGDSEKFFLYLLKQAGIPAVVVSIFGVCMALYQFWKTQDDFSTNVELEVLKLFSKMPRKSRALLKMVLLQISAIHVTIILADLHFHDPEVLSLISQWRSQVMRAAQYGYPALLIATNWWAFNKGDDVPHVLTSLILWPPLAHAWLVGIHMSVLKTSWSPFLIWSSISYLWFKLSHWAVDSASETARAIHNNVKQ